MSSEIGELTKTVNSFMLANVELTTELKSNQNHLTASMIQLSESVTVAITSNTNLEKKVTSALDKMDVVEDTVNSLSVIVSELQLEHANAQGVKYANDKNTQKHTASWTRIITAIGMVIALLTLAYKVLG